MRMSPEFDVKDIDDEAREGWQVPHLIDSLLIAILNV